MSIGQQLKMILRSRKFWALVASLATIWTTFFTMPGTITPLAAVLATVAALQTFAISIGLEGPNSPAKK